MSVRQKSWEVARGSSLRFSVIYYPKGTDLDNDPEPINIGDYVASVALVGGRFASTVASSRVEQVDEEGRVNVLIAPEDYVNMPQLFKYYVYLTNRYDGDDIICLARGTVKIT